MTRACTRARVSDLELTDPMPDVPALDGQGRTAESLWLLVRLDRTPIGVVTLPMGGTGVSRARLAAAVTETLGDTIADRLGVPADRLQVPLNGITVPDADARRTRRNDVASTGPEITVVVCTRDRPEALARCVGSLLDQEYRRFRILISDNSSEGATAPAVLRRYAGDSRMEPVDVETLRVRRPGLSRARNAALAAAPGQIIAWIDDDEVADVYWLSEVATALLNHPAADVVSGAVVPAVLDTAAQVWFEEFGGHSKGRGFTPAVFSPRTWRQQSPLYPLPPFGAGANLVTRPGVIEPVGGFDTALGAGTRARGGEDTLALMKVMLAGGTVAYHPAALTRHFHRPDRAGLRAQLAGYGTGLTAAYTSLVLHEPRRLLQLLALAPRAARDVLGGAGPRVATLGDDFPRELLRANLRGMLAGPFAYLTGHSKMSR